MTIDNLIAVGTLVFLEGILSADNALVLALLVRPLPTALQRKARLYGLAGAFAFRGLSILAAQWVIKVWWLQGLGALYLAYLGVAHFVRHRTLHHHEARQAPRSFWRIVVTVELTDIAFAVDAVLVAVALSDQLWVIYAGAVIGILAMRFAAGFFVSLLHRFPQVENMAYILVGWISIKLLFATFETFSAAVLQRPHPGHILPTWLFWTVLGLIVLLGGWYASRHPGEPARAPQEFPPAEELPEAIRAGRHRTSRW